MAASDANSCVYMDDTPNQIKNKVKNEFFMKIFNLFQIKKYAFSGGQETVELHREKGGDCSVDTSYQFLQFFLDDDEKLEEIRQVAAIF